MATKNLWAPWRLSYLQDMADKQDGLSGEDEGCFFCATAKVQDDSEQSEKHLLLINDSRGILMLNRYPYTNGHLLAAPCDHVCELSSMSARQRAGLMELAELGSRLLREAVGCQGVNIGMNIGGCAGAGLPGHVHMHIVPRWYGDVNFMTVTGQVRVIPDALKQSYHALKKALATIKA